MNLRPEVARQVFDTLSARLERTTAEVEEEGRQRVALLDAQTSAQVTALVAEAKGQYPAAVSRAFAVLGKPAGGSAMFAGWVLTESLLRQTCARRAPP